MSRGADKGKKGADHEDYGLVAWVRTKTGTSPRGVDSWLATSSVCHEGPRDDLCAAMLPLEAKTALFAYVAGTRGEPRYAVSRTISAKMITVMFFLFWG